MFRAVLFDFDGTLTKPGAIDFSVLRALIGCPPRAPILEFIEALEPEAARREAVRALDEFEQAAARASVPNDGAEELIGLLKERGIDRGILSRNSMASIVEGMKCFRAISPADFRAILSRESPGRPKPHPDGVLAAARLFEIAPGEMLVVGDYVFDIAAGRAAGAATAFLTNRRPVPPMEAAPDFTIEELGELRGVLGLRAPATPPPR